MSLVLLLALKIVILFVLLHGVVGLLSYFEHMFVVKSTPVKHRSMGWSLAFFKIMRTALLLSASVESILSARREWPVISSGVLLLIIGMGLRIQAIRVLGPMWSYHISIREGHCRVVGGLYNFMKHPAYLGNIYLVGLALLTGSVVVAWVALVFVLCFWILRGVEEGRVLRDTWDQRHA